MGDGTKIEWAEASANPIRAQSRESGRPGWYCSHASPGCDHCYSETLNRRLGTGIDYRAQDRGRVKLYLDEKILTQPLRWRRGRRIFWNSMSDTFGEFVPDEWIDRIMAVCALTPQHQHLFLTKRAERMRDYLSNESRLGDAWCRAAARFIGANFLPGAPDFPLQNCWFGVSVEDQRRAWERTSFLWQTPAAVRWVSLEPQLERVDLPLSWGAVRLNWVVVGGESGPGARPFDISWARSMIKQCKDAGVACFLKQLGSRPVHTSRDALVTAYPITASKGGDIAEFPADLRVREYPEVSQ